MKTTTKILVACLPGIVTGALLAASTGERAASQPNASAVSKAKESFGKLPLSFEPNRGQTDPRVQFLSRNPGYTVFFTNTGEAVLSLKDTPTSNAVVRMKFVGGATTPSAQPIDALPGPSNYLIGNDSSKWIKDVPEYTKLRYQNVYPGIDVVYLGEQRQLRYDFVVKPGADAKSIAMAFEGADKISVNKDGDLAITLDGKTLITRKPFAYQEIAGAKKEVASRFALNNGKVTFELAQYDASKELVIDPTVVFITFLGGLLNDSVNGVGIVNPTLTISSLPSAYFAVGTTTSPNFPTTTGVVQATQTGVNDVFVTKVSFNGNQIVWSTYLGGNSQDTGNAVAVDAVTANCLTAGCPIVVGQTFSANFPTVPFQLTNLSGTDDAFAAKLSADGKTLTYSVYLGGVTNDKATGVGIDLAGNAYVGGYTDSPYFLCPGNVIPPVGVNNCTNANHTNPGTSSDAFVVKLPSAFPTGGVSTITSTLYGGFGEDQASALAYNPVNNMVYIGGDTTTAAQNFIAPNNVNLPGITNNTVNAFTVPAEGGGTVTSGLPGSFPSARGGFVAAFDAATLIRTFASYLAVSPANSNGTEFITGIAAEGGAAATGCSTVSGTCTATSNKSATISATYGNIGHVYITGGTTSKVASGAIAPAITNAGNSCVNPLAAASIQATGPITGPNGTPVIVAQGQTTPAQCTTALVTQVPYNTNQADVSACPVPVPLPLVPTQHCNLSAFVAIMDGALVTDPAPLSLAAPVGNQIEYWAYYSSTNSSTIANAIAIDSNPTTLTSVYSLGTYQQMYITGGTTNTVGGGPNLLPTTNVTAQTLLNSTAANPSEIFTTYNVGTTAGGGVGGTNPVGPQALNQTSAFVARFNANGVEAVGYGGTDYTALACGVNPCRTPGHDQSNLIHTPQFNYGEFLYSVDATSDGSIPNTMGNAIAVDPTRAALVGGSTNEFQKGCPAAAPIPCHFTTTNFLPATGGNNNGGNDGWLAVLFFNDILTDAGSQSTANPFLQPGYPQLTPQTGTTAGCQPGGINDGKCSYIETTPAPYGPTFDFSIADPTTQTQTFQVIFTGQTAGQLLSPTPFFVPLDPRSNAIPPTIDNNLPGSGIVYWVPCTNPSATGTLNPGSSPSSAGYYNNDYPAPGSPYGPMVCTYPDPSHLYEKLSNLFTGWPGPTTAQANSGTFVTPGWLLVSQDVNPGVVRLQLDRRAAAGLLEGTYVAQFLVTTYDSQHVTQWPPCGPLSSLNPFQAGGGPNCTNPGTPLPADNASILVTVRLVVRPTLFLSRNAGILTGVTSSLGVNPLFGPSTGAGSTTLTQQDGTSKVPDWLYEGTQNDIANNALWPGTAGAPSYGLNNLFGALSNVNQGANVCAAGTAPATTIASIVNLQVVAAAVVPGGVLVPCPISATAPAPFPGAVLGATAYYGNGPGDGTTPGPGPNINFVYDSGSVLTITPGPLTNCVPANPPYPDPTNTTGNPAHACYLGPETNQAPIRPDQPNAPNAPLFNADWQGGVDPVTQRNDATLHDYYTTAEGAATLSVAAINCSGWGLNGVHNTAVGNWLAVQINNPTASGSPLSNYTSICTDATASTVGSVHAPATFCSSTNCTFHSGTGIGDDVAVPATIGGQLIPLDFLVKAFSGGCTNSNPTPSAATLTTPCTFNAGNVGPRAAMNGIPTGLYTAQVFVWATRAKNSAPGYCLGASMPASPNGVDPTPLCSPSTTAIASTANPNPEVLVQNVQTFNISLLVFDTTQTIQITPNTCPGTGVNNTITEFANVQQPENDFTGNVAPPAGTGTVPNYPNFGPNSNSNSLVAWSLLPFQTTGTSITGCFGPGGTTATGSPCPVNANAPIPLPTNVSVNPETLAQYNACVIPTGTFNGVMAINGQSVPGVGSLTQVGPLSQTQFVPSSNNTNNLVTIYSCRPTVAPAWLNSPLYPGNSLTPPGSPEQYANGNGPFGGPNAQAVTGCIADPVPNPCPHGQGPVPSISGLTCPLAFLPSSFKASNIGVFRPNGNPLQDALLLDTQGNKQYIPGTTTFISNFFPPASNVTPQAGDLAVAGDWSGGGHWTVGVFRPSTGQWWLDSNGDGVFTAGADASFSYGGLVSGGTPQDTPVVGDWTGTGRSCVGVFRSGFLWVLDTNCNQSQDAADNVFGFGGIAGDVPVTGNWGGTVSGTPATNGPTRVGLVREYAPGGVPQGNPFLWVLDAAAATDKTQADHVPCQVAATCGSAPFAFGGVTGDKYVTGDWLGTGIYHAAIYRGGNWLEDLTGAHTYDTFYQFGGTVTDQPVVGKW